VQCLQDSQCASTAPVCLNQSDCVQCITDTQCASVLGLPHCNSNRCVECNDSTQCTDPLRRTCNNNRCL
jgi:hypothetical protein